MAIGTDSGYRDYFTVLLFRVMPALATLIVF